MTDIDSIEPDRLLERIRIEAELLAGTVDSVDRAGLDAVVVGCPGLTLGEVARHVGSHYRMVWHWLRAGERPSEWRREPRPGQSLSEYVRAGARVLVAELAAHAPDEPCSTWLPDDQTYGFWRRRMAHESTVHRVDVQGAARLPLGPIPDDVALDGIDEILRVWFVYRLSVLGVAGTRRGIVSVRSAGREWLAYAGPHGTSVDEVDAPPDGILSGQPTDVYLWLWGRVSDRRVRHEFSEDAIAQLWALLRLATR